MMKVAGDDWGSVTKDVTRKMFTVIGDDISNHDCAHRSYTHCIHQPQIPFRFCLF